MSARAPLVSIGMPVFNEATHLADALAHLLAQDYPNLEITVCDNASTDATTSMAREWATRDSRVKVIVQPTNIGAAGNFEAAFQHARGKYFMWAAGHDRWSPNYVAACVAALEANPEAVLASGQSGWFGDEGTACTSPSALYSTVGLAPCARFLTVLHGNMHPVYGLILRDALVAIGGVPRMVGADLVLLTRLAWKGEFLAVPECWWYRRRIHGEEHYAQKMKRYRSARYQLAGSGLLARISPLAPLVVDLTRQCLSRPRSVLTRLALTGALPWLMMLRWLERD